MSARWLQTPMLSFDCETTGTDPEESRIVTASAIECGSDGATTRGLWLVNPGVPIPPEATAIHGVTNEAAQQNGEQPSDAIPRMAELLRGWWSAGLSVVVMNATYDLTLMRAECARIGCPFVVAGPVLDPLVLDRAVDPYRKGKRNLDALAAHYGVKRDTAHTAMGDALTAARVVWVLLRRHPHLAEMGLQALTDWQREEHAKWAGQFELYLRSKGKPDVVNREWPCR